MNEKQQDTFQRLQDGLSRRGSIQRLSVLEIKDEFLFTEVDGVTVLIGPKGGFKIPAVRSYPETGGPGEHAIDAALDPNFFFKKQSQDASCATGHFHPIVGSNWKCNGAACPCQGQTNEFDLKFRSLGS